MLSEEIQEQRRGNFTGSDNHRLMGRIDSAPVDRTIPNFDDLYKVVKSLKSAGRKKPLAGELKTNHDYVNGPLINAVWSALAADEPPAGLVSYAKEKALEHFLAYDPESKVSTRAIELGNEREETAIQLLSDQIEVNFTYTGDDQIHIVRDELGSTPDGLELNDIGLFNSGAEVKCFDRPHHGEMCLIRSSADIERLNSPLWWQVTTGMYLADVDHWWVAFYYPYPREQYPQLGLHYLRVDRDERAIKQLLTRAEMAKQIKADYIGEIEKTLEAVAA